MTGRVRVGVSGWLYKEWRGGAFYPDDLPQRRELNHIGEIFDTVEINATFYRTQAPGNFAKWAAQVPDGFLFSVKGSRYITHMLRLRNAQAALANFFASGVLRLGEKLGPLLWQLPPNFKFNRQQIDDFLSILPRDTKAAAWLARKHDHRLKRPPWLKTDVDRPLRYAFEIRHDSFKDQGFIDLLRDHRIALVCADTEDWPLWTDLTADFAYCRLHGSDELYFSNYSAAALTTWAKRVAAWAKGQDPSGPHVGGRNPHSRGRDVYVYFDNTAKVYAPANALTLREKVKPLLPPA